MIVKPLLELSSDQEAEIVAIKAGWIKQARFKELRIDAGHRIKKISRIGASGPVIVLVNRAQIAVGAGMASRIAVKVNSNA